MNRFRQSGLRAAILLALGAAIGSASVASRVNGSSAPAASSVQGAPVQPASEQVDESASLRNGTVTALDERGTRVQVQGVWLDVVGGKTQLSHHGQPARIDTLRVGETVRFTVVPGATQGQALRVVYAP